MKYGVGMTIKLNNPFYLPMVINGVADDCYCLKESVFKWRDYDIDHEATLNLNCKFKAGERVHIKGTTRTGRIVDRKIVFGKILYKTDTFYWISEEQLEPMEEYMKSLERELFIGAVFEKKLASVKVRERIAEDRKLADINAMQIMLDNGFSFNTPNHDIKQVIVNRKKKDGRICVIVRLDNGNEGVAKCDYRDSFDLEVGIALACFRAKIDKRERKDILNKVGKRVERKLNKGAVFTEF